jgi:hypothetical protein
VPIARRDHFRLAPLNVRTGDRTIGRLVRRIARLDHRRMNSSFDRRTALALAAILALLGGALVGSLTLTSVRTAAGSPTVLAPGSLTGLGATPTATIVAPAVPTTTPKATVGATPRATPKPTAKPTPKPTPPPLTACPMFPSTNVWNKRVDSLPVAANSDVMIAAIGISRGLHPDFSATGYGIPFNIVGTSTPRSSVSFDYASESDRVKYPIPSQPKIEGGSDRHLLMVDTNACKLYELFAAVRTTIGWHAGSGAVWDLRSNKLRPAGWTSADAAGLPILPGLVRYEDVARGTIAHAIRFTAPVTCDGYLYPARHEAGSGSCAMRPPMGLRVRLKASVNIAGYGSQARIVLTALKRYGMLLADNGSPWYITGAPNPRWNDDVLHALGGVTGSDFEVVDTTGFVNG